MDKRTQVKVQARAMTDRELEEEILKLQSLSLSPGYTLEDALDLQALRKERLSRSQNV